MGLHVTPIVELELHCATRHAICHIALAQSLLCFLFQLIGCEVLWRGLVAAVCLARSKCFSIVYAPSQFGGESIFCYGCNIRQAAPTERGRVARLLRKSHSGSAA